MTFFSVLRTIHVLSAVVWVGGMFFAYVVLRPSLAALEPAQRVALHRQVFRLFFRIIWHAMPLQLITGMWMLFFFYGGFRNVEWPIHTMFMLGWIMAAVFATIFFGPYKRFSTTQDQAVIAPALASIRRLMGINLCLGLLTIVIALVT